MDSPSHNRVPVTPNTVKLCFTLLSTWHWKCSIFFLKLLILVWGIEKSDTTSLFVVFSNFTEKLWGFALISCGSWKWTKMSVWRCLFYEIRAKHFQHFKTRDTFQFGRRMLLLLLFFFYLETDRFLPIIGVKSRKSDWNWRVWLKTRVCAILSALAQMSRAKGDVST